VLTAEDVTYEYGGDGASRVRALRGASLHVERGRSVALVGPSGAGKTTLLYCLAGIVVPSSGSVLLDGVRVDRLNTDERARLRLTRCGFVFQLAELVAELSLRENVELPLRLNGHRPRAARRRAEEVLERLGILDVAKRRPAQVSGGQAQRCAVARAVAHQPVMIFADEPTGSLDAASGAAALGELVRVSRECGAALVVVTHDRDVAFSMDRQVEVKDGRCA
jgi:putative ABC transport system ATP-binding protein